MVIKEWGEKLNKVMFLNLFRILNKIKTPRISEIQVICEIIVLNNFV